MNTPLSTRALVKQLKQDGCDMEWYPTTPEILQTIKDDIDRLVEDYILDQHPSVLDCGAGDGRSLLFLTEGKRFAIEKARPLIQAMDESIFIIGADFKQQTLMDKDQTILFSNPPYSEYDEWTVKIIRESNAAMIYLVIPQRWKDNVMIEQALRVRDARAETIGTFDFLSADRTARAKVEIVKIALCEDRKGQSASSDDPFEIWFNESFKISMTHNNDSSCTIDRELAEAKKTKIKNELIDGRGVIDVLTSLYDRDLQHLVKNYKALEQIDPALLSELDVSFNGLREAFRGKIGGLKNLYWDELFNRLNTITDKLTKGSREALLNTLTSQTSVDFNSDNVYAVVIWVIKHANHYFDSQLVSFMERMTEQANVINYTSNKKTFSDNSWRYYRYPDDLERYSLDYRVVLQRVGGINTSIWGNDPRYKGLTPSAHFFILDALTIATNLGFDTVGRTQIQDESWESNKKQDFYYFDHAKKKEVLLMSVRAFMNQNLHIKFNPAFIMKLNVEFGRLKGWLKNTHDAASELDIDLEQAQDSFNSNLTITHNDVALLNVDVAA